MERSKDYYVVLGVARDASAAAIRRAFRRLARKLESAGAAAEVDRLRTAYETLSDAEQRKRYDESLQRNERELEHLSHSIARSAVGGELRRPVQPGSLSGEISLSPEEARRGGVLPLDLPIETSCPACSGTGGPVFDCPDCGGDGRIRTRLPVPLHIPRHVRDGAVFQVRLDRPAIVSIVITVHIRPQ